MTARWMILLRHDQVIRFANPSDCGFEGTISREHASAVNHWPRHSRVSPVRAHARGNSNRVFAEQVRLGTSGDGRNAGMGDPPLHRDGKEFLDQLG